jgi:hypothetical protein
VHFYVSIAMITHRCIVWLILELSRRLECSDYKIANNWCHNLMLKL